MSRDYAYRFMVGVGGIGSGMFVALEGNETLGRNESRAGTIPPRRDFCKLHIIAHYVAALTGRGGGGFTVHPVGKVGDDDAGGAMTRCMAEGGMDTQFVAVEPDRPTMFSICFTYPDGDGGNVTTADSACSHLTPKDVEDAISALPEAGGIALAAPEVPLPARDRLLELARARGWLTAAALNTAEVPEALSRGMLGRIDLLSMNRDEAAALAGVEPTDAPETIARKAGERLAAANPTARLCVTAGAAGAYGWADGQLEHVPPATVEVVNTAGAGDAAMAGLIVGEIAGLPFIQPGRPERATLADSGLNTALDLAALLAGLSVASVDTINFDADAEALRRLAADIGADVTGLESALALGGA